MDGMHDTGSIPGIEAALVAVEQLLADTVDAVDPDTPASELLKYTTRYRSNLSVLVTLCREETAHHQAASA